MEGSLLRRPAKRSMNEEGKQRHELPNADAAANGSHKRYKAPPPPLIIPDGHVSFRLLCHTSVVHSLIGKYGVVVKQLQKQYSAKIRVEDAVRGTDDRVVIVIASNKLQSFEYGGEASPAQEALLRVFEKVLDLSFEEIGVCTIVSCRLLVDGSQVGVLIGKGGKALESIKKDTLCRIRVLNGNKVPPCAGRHEQLLQIEGDADAVKKGLIAVSRRLQDCLRLGTDEVRSEFPRKKIRPTYLQMTYKILCLNDRVGGVIGRHGTIARYLADETGAIIRVGPVIMDCDEQLITVTAADSPDLQHSPAQDAAMLVFSRSIEAGVERGLAPDPSTGVTVYARLVVDKSQVGCLVGKILPEMRSSTGANIRLLRGDLVPICAQQNAGVQVVHIAGNIESVQYAFYQVTGKLRAHFLFGNNGGIASVDRSIISMSQIHTSPCKIPQGSSKIEADSCPNNHNHVDLVAPHNFDKPPSPRLCIAEHKASSSSEVGTEVGSRSTTVIVRNTTIQVLVPEHLLGNIYGENGSNLTCLRQISGAKVTLHDPKPETRESIIVISGTPDETQAAQSLLHAFILMGSL